MMRETLRKHGIEAQPASEFTAREEGCWLLTDGQFAGMECRVVVVVGCGYTDTNAACRCNSYLTYVTKMDNTFWDVQERFIRSPAVKFINLYPAGTAEHREVQYTIDGKFNVYIGSRLLGHIVCFMSI